MAASKKPPVKKVATVTKEVKRPPRKLPVPKYKTLRLSKRIKHPAPKLPSAFKLFKQSSRTLLSNWKLFTGIIFVYGILHILLVRGLGNGLDLASFKSNINSLFSSSYGSLGTSIALFGYLLGSSGSTITEAGNVYQFFLLIITSTVLIWALRQIYAGKKTTIRESYYKGPYPLVPFVLILSVMTLQLIPLWIGSTVYSVVINNGLAATSAEKFLWLLLLICTGLLSLYMLSSSIFSLYIVTLPDMTPMRALRSARQLVLNRRAEVIRKIIFLPFVLILLGAIIIVPILVWATGIAEPVFIAVGIIALAIIHSYFYTLYRALL
jgi:hypothetical protein